MKYKDCLKKVIDILIASFGLLILSPIFILITIGLFFANQGKPFFFQIRPGKGERNFKIIKFKTMNDKKDAQGNLLSDAKRLTKIGSFVRKTSLDEIPQLLNVIKGEMSLIGPRPLRVHYLEVYNKKQRRRHSVKPGITGWAQVNGRNTISWTQKFEYDIWYVDNNSFILDFKIILLTFHKVFKAKDINASDDEPLQSFNGIN